MDRTFPLNSYSPEPETMEATTIIEAAANVAEIIGVIGIFLMVGGIFIKIYQNKQKVEVKIINTFGWTLMVRPSSDKNDEKWIEIKNSQVFEDRYSSEDGTTLLKDSHIFEFYGNMFGSSSHWCEAMLRHPKAPKNQEPQKFPVYGDGIPKQQVTHCNLFGGYIEYDGGTFIRSWPKAWFLPDCPSDTSTAIPFPQAVRWMRDGNTVTAIIPATRINDDSQCLIDNSGNATTTI